MFRSPTAVESVDKALAAVALDHRHRNAVVGLVTVVRVAATRYRAAFEPVSAHALDVHCALPKDVAAIVRAYAAPHA